MALLGSMAADINRVDEDRNSKAVGAAVDGLLTHMLLGVVDEASWNEAYANTSVSFDKAWLDTTWGGTARIGDDYDEVVVTDALGNIVYGAGQAGVLTGTIGARYSGGAEMIAQLDAAVRKTGDGAAVSNFARRGATVAVVAASVIHNTVGDSAPLPADRHILWLSDGTSGGTLQEIATRFEIPALALAPSVNPGTQAVPLRDASGAGLGYLTWRPSRPGDAAFMHAASAAAFGALAIGVMLFVGLVAFRKSVERRAEGEERDWIKVRYDDGTGLLTRFGLLERVEHLMQRSSGDMSVAVAVIGVEGLREAASNYGEATVESLVAALVEAVALAAEDGALLARLSRDELAICLVGDDLYARASGHARRVLEIIGAPVSVPGLSLKLGASVGVAKDCVQQSNMPAILDMADAALQRTRETGGGHTVTYDHSIEQARQRRIGLQADIRRGLDADEFDLDYQPIFDTNVDDFVAVEALLRWRRRPSGPMSPSEFIPAAEAAGLIDDLGVFALRRATQELASFGTLRLSVNVSTLQLHNPLLIDQIDKALADSGFPADRLQVEITESSLVDQPERAMQAIGEIFARGIQIALDDFGTGYSSIGFLRNFRFDRLKLDRSLCSEIDRDTVKAAIVQSTIVFASTMGLAVTAEGVERPEEVALLSELGCHSFQGYLFARPMTLAALSDLVATSAERKAISA